MQSLERRIVALETIAPPTGGLTIVRRIVSPGHLDAETDHIRDDGGSTWARRPGESETAFTDRAVSETQSNKLGIKYLIASNMELHHANQ
jgi:hypothetical protein